MKKMIAVAVVAMLLVGGTIGICAADQPHMRAALDHLREAREQLERATPNKGGHREKAIELIDRAMKQVKEGIEFGEHHERYEHR
jgi:hypothetical protein